MEVINILQKYNKRLEASELISSAYCNMDCRYCYIIKNSELLDIHKEIIRQIEDGTLIDNLYKLFNDKLTHLSIWGTEPTLTLPVVENKLDYILNLFPKLRKIHFSTNMLARTETIHNFINKINQIMIQKPDRKMEIQIQMSLDGPKEITDYNRKENSTEIIVSNIIKLAQFLSTTELSDNFNISLVFKPTMCAENIDFFLNQNGTEKYFDFFNDLIGRINRIIKFKKNIRPPVGCSLTLMVPGMYTVNDGKSYAKFVEVLCEKEIKDRKNQKYQFIKETYVSYLSDLYHFLNSIENYHFRASQQTCSAGDSCIGPDQLGNIHMCHNSYNLVNDKYLELIYKDQSNKEYDVVSYDKEFTKYMKDNYIVHSDDEYEISRLMTVMRGFHDFNEMKVSFTRTLIKELALADLIDKEFLYNDNLTQIFAMFVTSRFSCPYNNLACTKVIHFMGVSLIKFLGNGAFQNILKYLNIFKEMKYL